MCMEPAGLVFRICSDCKEEGEIYTLQHFKKENRLFYSVCTNVPRMLVSKPNEQAASVWSGLLPHPAKKSLKLAHEFVTL